MESISQLVSDSLARHGMEPSLDHLRLQWSRWIRCESSFSVLLVPAKPGIFALGEEMVPAASDMEQRAPALSRVEKDSLERRASSPVEGKRMLALFQISEADDLGMALGRLFLPGNPLLAKLNSGRCYTRYAVIDDAAQRSAAYAIFERWMRDSAETASGIGSCGADALVREDVGQQPRGADTLVHEGAPSLSSVNFARQEPALSDRRAGGSRMGGEVDFLCGSEISVPEGVDNKDVDSEVVRAVPPSISSAWGVGFTEVQNREAREVIRRPQPLPSGF